uniref:Uncharacterized protein n=1 Tax=Rhizophora mucronata TaxID=61149 RepID=A0A2P2IXI8_RHIMU
MLTFHFTDNLQFQLNVTIDTHSTQQEKRAV